MAKLKLAMFPITEDLFRMCIDALEYKGAMEAGHSQAPYLFSREETDEWQAAQKMKRRLQRYEERVGTTYEGAGSPPGSLIDAQHGD